MSYGTKEINDQISKIPEEKLRNFCGLLYADHLFGTPKSIVFSKNYG